MIINFTKMHGLGNDFVILDKTAGKLSDLVIDYNFIVSMGNRHFGVGFDQLLVIMDSNEYDFEYYIYNNDGSQVEMCGNGIRCFTKYVVERGLTNKTNLSVLTKKGVIQTQYLQDGVRVDMGKTILDKVQIPVLKTSNIIQIGEDRIRFIPVSMGNPHAVVFVEDDLDNYPVDEQGYFIENASDYFPNRTNVEFVNVIGKNEIKVKVRERGAGKTLACGTGACASVVAGIVEGKLATNENIKVNLDGGTLNINWSGNKQDSVIMFGPASFVFDGQYLYNN